MDAFILLCMIPLAWVLGFFEGKSSERRKWDDREDALRKRIRSDIRREDEKQRY